jgi:general secretion pathway protein F
MYRAMVLAGENAGYLGPVLTRLADHAENRQFTQQKLRMAMIYPLILVGVAAAVIAALMRFVVPELVRIFQTSNADLPLLTRILIATSNFLGDFGLALLLGVVLGLVALGRLFRNEAARLRRDHFLLRVPIVGELLRGLESARYASTLSILIGSGVPMLQALGIAGEVLGNRVLRQAAEGVRVRVEQGTSLHRALEDSAQFPPMLVHLIASGEASGELESMLSRAATTQERDTEMALGAMMSLFEPLLVVFMGGFVLLVVLAVLMPIFDLNTLVK